MPILRSGKCAPINAAPGRYVVREVAAQVNPDLGDEACAMIASLLARQHDPRALPVEWLLEQSLPDVLTDRVVTALRVRAAVPLTDRDATATA